MVNWNSKLVNFLNNNNVVLINGIKEFISFNSLLKKVGLDLFKNRDFHELCDSTRNYCLSRNKKYGFNYNQVIIEYNNGKGLCVGWSSIKECEDWFEQKPYTVKEILEEIRA